MLQRLATLCLVFLLATAATARAQTEKKALPRISVANKSHLLANSLLQRTQFSSKSELAGRMKVQITQLESPVVLTPQHMFERRGSNAVYLSFMGYVGTAPNQNKFHIHTSSGTELRSYLRIELEGAVHLSQRKALECEVYSRTGLKVKTHVGAVEAEITLPANTTRVLSGVLAPRERFAMSFDTLSASRHDDVLAGHVTRCVVTPVH